MISFKQYLIELTTIDRISLVTFPGKWNTEISPWMGKSGHTEAQNRSEGLGALGWLHHHLSNHLWDVMGEGSDDKEEKDVASISSNLLADFASYDNLRKYMIKNIAKTEGMEERINYYFDRAALHHPQFNLWMQENSDMVSYHEKDGGHVTELIPDFLSEQEDDADNNAQPSK